MAGPLDGVRVLELPAIGPVPFLGMLLADLGADVIRIDKLPASRAVRRAARRSAGPRAPLDRARPAQAGRRRGRCCAWPSGCDALIEGFRPGVAERLGIGPDDGAGPQPAAGLRADDRLGAGRPARVHRRARHHLPGDHRPAARHRPGRRARRCRRSTTSPTSAAARCSSPPGCSPRCCTRAPPATGRSWTPR